MAHKIHSEPERTFGCFEQLSICNFKPPVPVEHFAMTYKVKNMNF